VRNLKVKIHKIKMLWFTVNRKQRVGGLAKTVLISDLRSLSVSGQLVQEKGE